MRTRPPMSTPPMIKYFEYFLRVMIFLTLVLPQSSWAKSSRLNEYEVKASYLFNFAKYVEWPSSAFPRESTPLTMCIIGKSPLNEVIESLTGKTIQNRRVVIRQFSKVEDLNECNILFVNAATKTPLPQILAFLAPHPILTVSDGKGFASDGGTIEFIPVGDNIRFKINNRAAQKAHIKISSHLLRLATSVIE